MNQLPSVLAFILLIGILFIIALRRSDFCLNANWSRIGRAEKAPWILAEFLKLRPDQWRKGECYRFNEEEVRSFAHRFVGRFDSAVLHWEDVPVLDALIEYKFPVSYLPNKSKREDIFQAGLYSLALQESGVSCSSTILVIVYCIQDKARKCLNGNSNNNCLTCGDARVFKEKYNPNRIRWHLRKLDEVWYNKRRSRAKPSATTCRTCPFAGGGVCNYSAL